MERVMIFVDGSNFYHGLKRYAGKTNLDFSKLAQKLAGDRKLVRLYYYNSSIKQEDDPAKYKGQQGFFEKLRRAPYVEVRLGRLEARLSGDGSRYYVEKGVDISIAVDMLRYAYNDSYDTAILVTGDGDFVRAVEAVKDMGKHVEHAYFKPAKAHHLKEASDRFRPLSEFLGGCFLD